MSDREIKDLSVAMIPKVNSWIVCMLAEKIDYIITCTKRTEAEQESLYAQGRTTPGNIVTWTLNSKHLTGDAFDFVIMFNGKPDWSMQHKDLWNKAVEIGKSLGLTQVIGKDGKVKEFAHLQLKEA
jgi:peptidoglycan LD-endopeptidase CwlK